MSEVIARGVQSPGELPLGCPPGGAPPDSKQSRRLEAVREAAYQVFQTPSHSGAAHRVPPGSSGPSRLPPIGIPVLHLSGSPLDRAEQMGDLLRPILPPLLEAFFSGAVPSALGRWGMKTALSLVARRLPRDLRLEGSRISRAAGIPLSHALALTLMGDFHAALGCSTIVLTPPQIPSKNLVFGRNLDFMGFGLSDVAAVLLIHHPQPGSGEIPHTSLGWAGLWGIHTGWNAAGLALGNMQVYNPLPESPHGPFQMLSGRCPTSWGYAQLLRSCSTVREALDRMSGIQPLSPTNLMMADATGDAALVEWDIHRRCIRRPVNGRLFATNYFVDESMTRDRVDCWRFLRLEQELGPWKGENSGTADLPSDSNSDSSDPEAEGATRIRRLLHEVNQGELTLHSIVFEPIRRRVQLAAGTPPSSQGPWYSLPWNVWL